MQAYPPNQQPPDSNRTGPSFTPPRYYAPSQPLQPNQQMPPNYPPTSSGYWPAGPQTSPQPHYPYPTTSQHRLAGLPPLAPKKRRRRWPWIVLIVVAFLAVSVISADLIVMHTQGGSVDQANQPTTVLTQTPANSPAVTPSSVKPVSGPALIGSVVGTFVTKYGQPNKHSLPAQHSYDFSLYGGDKNDLSVMNIYNKYVNAILYNAPTNRLWNQNEALQACSLFLPADAKPQRQMTIPDAQGNPLDEQYVYASPSLGKLFPTSAFNDENGKPASPGTIGLILHHWTSTTYVGCTVQVGLEGK